MYLRIKKHVPTDNSDTGMRNQKLKFDIRSVQKIGQWSIEEFSSICLKSVYYGTASRAVLPLVCSYTFGLGQRGMAGLLIWASRLGF